MTKVPHPTMFFTQTLVIVRECPAIPLKARLLHGRARRLSRGALFVPRKCPGFIIRTI
jgi:hypothetical protein